MAKNKTITFTEKEWLYFQKLKSIGVNPNQFIRLAFREKINKEYKTIEKEIAKLTSYKHPF